MPLTSVAVFAPPVLAQAYTLPSYFETVVLVSLGLGALSWLVAAVLGFTRARAFGASARWFALSAACLVIFHLQLVVFALVFDSDPSLGLSLGAFFNLFIVLAAFCAIIGFKRLTDPR